MNFNALLYYKNINNLCNAYDKKLSELDFTTPDDKALLFAADKTLYLFCQATETYCTLMHQFETSDLKEDTKRELMDGLQMFKSKCNQLLTQLEDLHNRMPDKVDPTKEFITVGKHIFRSETIDIRDMLAKTEDQHKKNMTDVRNYKNAIVNGTLMSQYSMVDVADATHKLAKAKILINHCLAPASLLSTDDDLIRVGAAIKQKVNNREKEKEVSTMLTPQGMLCSLYSHNLNLQDQKAIMSGETVESVLARKDDPENLEDYEHIFSLLTTDHTGLIYTQNNDKFGEMQIGKWFNKDNAKVSHLIEFHSQNKWDGNKKIKNNDFINMINSTIKGLKNIKEAIFPIKEMVEKKIDSLLGQEAAEKIADVITDPQAIKFILRAEDKWTILQSKADLDELINMTDAQHMQAIKTHIYSNAEITRMQRDEDPQQWELMKEAASKLIESSAETMQFIYNLVQNQSIGALGAANMAGVLIDIVVPFDDFTNCSIDENINRASTYSNKLLSMAVANEKWLETRDPQYSNEMKTIVNGLDTSEAKQFLSDANFIKKMKIDAFMARNQIQIQDTTQGQRER
jgi:hypothetical protein